MESARFIISGSEYLTLEGNDWTYECEVMIARDFKGDKFYRMSDLHVGLSECCGIGEIRRDDDIVLINDEGKPSRYTSELSARDMAELFILHVNSCDVCHSALIAYEISSDDEEIISPIMCVRTRSMGDDPANIADTELADPGYDSEEDGLDDADNANTADVGPRASAKRHRIDLSDSDDDGDYLPQPRFKIQKRE